MFKFAFVDTLILVLILGFIGTLDLSNLSTLQSMGVLSGIAWIILLIFRLMKQGKAASAKKPEPKALSKTKRQKR